MAGKRRSLEERIAAQQAELDKLLAKQRAAELENDPRLERINSALAKYNTMFVRAKRTINGAGRGKGAEARIADLQAEIVELTERLARDSQVILVVEDHIKALESFRDSIVSGETEADAKLPAPPECLRNNVYALTQFEYERELEAKARAEQKGESTDAASVAENAQV